MKLLWKDKDGCWQEADTREARIMNGEDLIIQAWDLYSYDAPGPKKFRIDVRGDFPITDQGGE